MYEQYQKYLERDKIYNNYKRVKNTLSDISKCLSSNSSTFTNQVEISNIFNNYFASIAEKTKGRISYSHKHFSDFLKDKN